MLTNNNGMDLMLPSQPNKDVVFNEAMIKLDSFCNFAVDSFEEKIPDKLTIGAMYIIFEGEHKMSLCYCPSEAAGWRIQKAKKGMVFFVCSENSFFYFDGVKWEPTGTLSTGGGSAFDASEVMVPKTTGVAGVFHVPSGSSKLWLYMSGDGKVDFSSATSNMITLIIKQNYQKSCRLDFAGNILWKDKKPFQISAKLNSMDIIRFHKISETDHWLAEIVGQGFEY